MFARYSPVRDFIAPIVVAVAAIMGSVSAQEAGRAAQAAPFAIPDDVSVGKETIWSEGTRMAANIYSPKGVTGKLPTIVMAYGWGGTMERFRAEAAAFAQAGYLVVTFDYRGWGESDSRVILAATEPAVRAGDRFTAEVIALREILDPLAEVEDLSNVIHWLQAEPQSDTSRIGLWGTSFGGGVAAYVAGYDHRIKALHLQVAPLELRALDPFGYRDGTKRARGELGYPGPGLVVVSGLRGAPVSEHFLRYSPAQTLALAPDCAIQIVLAEKEELFDVRPVVAAYESFKGSKKNLVTVPDAGHYDLYGKARDQARALSLAWFDKFLKQ
jgi:pimeloyl-ACP methyl ester carboxylesterase